MGNYLAMTSNSIENLSLRAIVGAVIAILFLILIFNIFKNQEIKRIAYILILAVIILSSAVLATTAITHMQESLWIA
jgi:Ca2+/Na+ antiporter